MIDYQKSVDAINLIIEAYKISELSEAQFGYLLKHIGQDFIDGSIDKEPVLDA